MKVKIFWQKSCPHCPPAKELGDRLMKDGVEVEFFDILTPRGLGEAAFFNVLSTPSIVVADGSKAVTSWNGKTPSMEELKKALDVKDG